MVLRAGEFLTVPISFTIPAHCLATDGWNRAPEQGEEEQDSDNLQVVAPFETAGTLSL